MSDSDKCFGEKLSKEGKNVGEWIGESSLECSWQAKAHGQGLHGRDKGEPELPHGYVKAQVGNAWHFPGTTVRLEQHIQGL